MKASFCNYVLPELRAEIIRLAEDSLPPYSGATSYLEILIEFTYGDDHQYISVVFLRPQKSMLVAYNHGANKDNLSDQYKISCNHAISWRYDGLSFFNQILPKPTNSELVSAQTKNGVFLEAGDYIFLEEAIVSN